MHLKPVPFMGFSIKHTISSIYVLVMLTCTASFLSHDQECLALIEFKQTVLPQNYSFHKFDSWRKITGNASLSSYDCCLWDGVVCSTKGHVIGLDLSRSSLTGVINSSSTLFKLVHLQTLNLSMNNFVESQIPFEIARLNQLRRLDLSSSGFIGQIPNEISQLMQLSLLDLSRNPLKLESSHGLEYLLQNMSRLEFLDLCDVDLSSSVPRVLANFSSLRFIALRGCSLKGEFPSEIFHLPKLKYLDMGNNYELTGSLPEFHNNTLLKYLSLFLTGFTGIVPESISNLNNLQVLALDMCDFTGLVPSLESLSKLTVLALGVNSFEIGREYGWISKLTKLDTLYLSDMNIHDEILPYLANLTKLRVLKARDNFIFGRIPFSFLNLTQLTTFDFENNQLQGQILSSFKNFKDITYIDIGSNNFSGEVGVDSFVGLNKLKLLNLDHNNLSFVSTNHTNDTLPELEYLGLSSCNLKEFPAFLQFQTNLTGLFLRDNEIRLIPNWIWNNTRETLRMLGMSGNFITGFHQHPRFLPWIHLEFFEMSYNQLQGRLPIPPKTIVVYDVSNNNLTGEIPTLVCEMKYLQSLELSSNKMTGNLPPCLGNLNNSLMVLDLKRNNFHGPMVKTCTQGSILKTIDLSENQFTGQVSKSIANCSNLEFLSLVDNSFEDVFPVWMGYLPNLQVLLLRSNKFYGAIESLSPFPKLRIIDISSNYFTGQLPDKLFQRWDAMKFGYVGESSAAMGSRISVKEIDIGPFFFQYSMTLANKGVKREYEKILNIFTAIDLSCNSFEGQIPQSLQDLHGLESLNLSNNHFIGHILPSFGNLVNLESLDLSQNDLSGQIPQQLLQLGFLSILNVSFNHLTGNIPQGKQFNTFETDSYLGNPRLCGKPLSNECEKSKVRTIHPPTSSNEYESLMPSDRIDWMVILLGVGSGLVLGIVIGSFLYARYGDWFFKRSGRKKDRFVRPLRNTRKKN